MKKNTFDKVGAEMVEKWLNSDPQIKHLTLRAVKTLPQKLKEISKEINNKSYKKAAFKVHNLKGLALNFNLKEVYLITDELNEELKKENCNQKKVNTLYQELNNLIKTIPDSYL